jgi:predicted phosphodiesterase
LLSGRVKRAKSPQNSAITGLLINKVYGAGSSNDNSAPCSHSFIELYNSSGSVMNLNGLAIQYGEYMKSWQMLALRGEIKPYSSFVIRCAQHSSLFRRTTRFKITDFDMSWNISISDNGFKVYLNIPTDITTPTTYTNPANTDGSWTKETGYIDLFAAGGQDTSRIIDGYLKGYLQITNKYRMIKRMYSTDVTCIFSSTGDNSADLEYLDMRNADVDLYMPRSTKYGQWDYYYNQPPLNKETPNVVFIGFGQNGDTTRTFTWQTPVTKYGYLKYKLKSATEWTIIESTKTFVTHPDVDVTKHSAIVRNLTPGIYVYTVGEEGHWSDEYELEIINATDTNRTMKILWTSDQQGWDDFEYDAWGKANDYIAKNETYDFILNTGDISQNSDRSYEWREYYNHSIDNIRTHPHMTCVGNNDLATDAAGNTKADPTPFTYYSTVENCPYPSVYSFNYGFCHFISLNSNFPTANATVAQQIAFIKDDMNFTTHPQNQKRWTIVYMHESPYTVIRNSKMLNYIDTFNLVGVDLVLCGHHHRYTRSYRMGALDRTDTTNIKDVINNNLATNGTYYVMMGACGMKQDGKTVAATVAPWRADLEVLGEPQYGLWEISYNQMILRSYRLSNILPLVDNVGKDVVATQFDEGVTITKN